MNEMFSTYMQDNITRNATIRLCQPCRKTNKGQKGLSFLGPSLWNKIILIRSNITLRLISLINLWRKVRFIGTNFEKSSVFHSISVCAVCIVVLVLVMRLCFYVRTTMKIRLSNLSCVILASIIVVDLFLYFFICMVHFFVFCFGSHVFLFCGWIILTYLLNKPFGPLDLFQWI